MIFHFTEHQTVTSEAIWLVEADSLEEACRKYEKRREDTPPDCVDDDVLDSELVLVTDETGKVCDMDEVNDILYGEEVEESPVCPLCEEPILPGDAVTEDNHGLRHKHCPATTHDAPE